MVSPLIAMNPLSPRQNAIWLFPLSHQFVTAVPNTALLNWDMWTICLHLCSQTHPPPQVPSGLIGTSSVIPSVLGGPAYIRIENGCIYIFSQIPYTYYEESSSRDSVRAIENYNPKPYFCVFKCVGRHESSETVGPGKSKGDGHFVETRLLVSYNRRPSCSVSTLIIMVVNKDNCHIFWKPALALK
jgi:hypothetical protein